MKSLKILLLSILVGCAHGPGSKPATQQAGPPLPPITVAEKSNSTEVPETPTVIMVSIDGFRWDYPEVYRVRSLLDIERNGRKAHSLIPVFPTKTFPNHYSLVTGLYPANHGIMDNKFYDPERNKDYNMSDPFTVRDGSWYGGTPLWVAAEKAGLVSASFFWVGTDAPIQGVRPTYSFLYDSTISNEARVQRALEWLALPAQKRPRLITLYFSSVDNLGHKEGPTAVAEAVLEIDGLLHKLRQGIHQSRTPVHLIIVSDHGMGQLDPKKTIDLSALIDLKQFEVSGGGPFTMLHAKSKAQLKAAYQKLKSVGPHLQVYWKADIPKRFHLSGSQRIGDIALLAEFPWYMTTKPITDKKRPSNQTGTHGWDNQLTDMHGIFYLEGPWIKPGPTLLPFENIHVYPLVLKLLGLKIPKNIDGDEKVLGSLVENPEEAQ